MSAKQAINDKFQASVATYLMCGGDVNQNKGYCWVREWKKIVISEYWQSYKQECGCLMHFERLANTLLKDKESARDTHVFACNFAKYSLIKKNFHAQTQL